MSLIYDSDYSVRLATLGAMGGDTTKCYDSTYEIDLAILEAIEGGGGGGAAIRDVDELPDAEENKDNIYRLSSDGKLYVASATTYSYDVPAPDASQINNAYFTDNFSPNLYYTGEQYTLTDGENSYTAYKWVNAEDWAIYTLLKPEEMVDLSAANIIIIQPGNGEWTDRGNNVLYCADGMYDDNVAGQGFSEPYIVTEEIEETEWEWIELGSSAAIDDNNVSTGTTWSSAKITAELADAGFDVSIAQSLPASGDAHTIYFIENEDPGTSNIYDEYMYIGDQWELVGSTGVDLSNYATKNDISIFSPIVEITQAEYDALPTASKNDGSVYSITDAVIVDMNDYYTKTQADAKYNPLATVSQSTSGYKFPTWNNHGQVTGSAATAQQSSFSINGTSKTLYTTATGALTSIYAPTSAGTSGQYLVSSGSGAPTWQALEVASDYVISDADASAGTYSTDIANFYTKTIDENIVQGVQIKIVNNHSNYEVSTNEAINLEDGSIFAVAENAAVTIRLLVNTRAGEQYKYIEIAADGTIDDTEAPGTITTNALSITGYNIYQFNDLSAGYLWQGFDSGIGYAIDIVTETSDSYYLPSSSRIYSGNVELWLMSTEDGQTWENRHYLITNNSVSRDISTGTFGPANA